MNINRVSLLIACIMLIALLSACGDAAGGQNESVQNAITDSMTNTQLDVEATDTTKTTEETPQLSVSGGVVERPKDELIEFGEEVLEEESKKNFFETIIDTVTGWFGGGSDSDKEQVTGNDQQAAGNTKPTESTQNSTQATTNTEQETDVPEQNTGSAEQPPSESTEATAPGKDVLTYEEYLELSAAERMAYYESFGDPGAFTLWFQAAKEAYNNGSAVEIGGGGSIDLTP